MSSNENSSLKTVDSVNENQETSAKQNLKIENLAALDTNADLQLPRLTGIICTIGPSSNDEGKLMEMMAAGMSIARLNFSHGTHEEHIATINKIREAAKKFSQSCVISEAPIGIAIDTKGPEIRTGLLMEGETGEVELEAGEMIKVTVNDEMKTKGTAQIIYINNKEIIKVLKPGNKIYIDNGLISLIVRAIKEDYMVCEIENNASLGSKKGVHCPGVELNLPQVSKEDVLDIRCAVDNNVDFVFASYIRNADGVKQIRKALRENGKHIKVIAKIENQEAVKNVDEIIAESDGVMVARGELGVEMPMEKVFVAQKMITAKCNKIGKPVISATHMMESMVWNPRPTRAECSDVANAVLDGIDCIVLAGETARGKYPVEAISIANSICREAEAAFFTKHVFNDLYYLTPFPTPPQTTIAIAVANASCKSKAAAIIVISSTGQTSHLVAKYRPRCPILLVSQHKLVTRQAYLYRGILPVWYDQQPLDDWQQDIEKRVKRSFEVGKKRGFLKDNDEVIIVHGWRKGGGNTNCMRIVTVT